MLDYIKPGDQIERFAFIRQSFRGPLPHIVQSPGAAKIERFGGNVHAFGASKARKRFQITAGAAANIQNSWLAVPFRAQLITNATDKVRDDAAAADVPPVLVLDLAHD